MRFLPSFLSLSLVAVTLVVASACADQAEGERCATENNNSDCESGLICKKLSELGVTGDAASAGVCCPPPNGSPATTQACLRQKSEVPGDAGPNGRADTGTTPVTPVPEASTPRLVDAQSATRD